MRRWIILRIKDFLTANPALGITADKVLQSGSVGTPNVPKVQPPLIIVRMLDEAAGMGHVVRQPFWVWVHDAQGISYSHRIDPVLDGIRDYLTALPPALSDDGWRIMDCLWEGASGDLVDDMMVTSTRYGQFRLTGHP